VQQQSARQAGQQSLSRKQKLNVLSQIEARALMEGDEGGQDSSTPSSQAHGSRTAQPRPKKQQKILERLAQEKAGTEAAGARLTAIRAKLKGDQEDRKTMLHFLNRVEPANSR
jgi:hypothetical protein